ncbi:MAG: hypothetical protein DRO99_03935, partial [Candidatus Aenigmatarchaeota archaeon]
MFYYHHFGGLGHGTRVKSLVKAICSLIPSSEVIIANSGLPQKELGLDKLARIFQLPPLVSQNGMFDGLRPV